MKNIFIASHVLEKVYAEVQQRFTGIDDLAHGWEHINRVYKLALYIAKQEQADTFIVGMAALLHDLGRAVPPQQETSPDKTAHHADLSVILARELLQDHQVPMAQQDAILHAIIAHSFSRGVEPRSLEAGVVRDADRLDGLGAIGVMRWAVTGALRRTLQTQSYHPTDPFAAQHTLNDAHYMLDHFYSKLLKLAETMSTTTGRALGQQRTQFMLTYLDEFRSELAIG